MKKEKNTQKESHSFVDKTQQDQYGLDPYGLDPETSLLSVNFATTENLYFNDHIDEES